ncbi:uncharacterized protein LOC126780104 isoform X2 [Nymphalis io]|uniref:uncharacterized protein LOC126780104 isoform X2 n=1 Tax=Inachis io TaxID=171585 RepID=UPI00216735BA|nr:uncharacterized protein LOC126780104 isoform X2 [Nymphalis io]
MLNNIKRFTTYVLVLVCTTQCRKYDVNEEAHKLYGEDLDSVLQRFRRTPEYLKILNYKLEDLTKSMERIFAETFYHYNTELETEVRRMFGGNATQLRSFHHPFEKIINRKRKILKSGTTKSRVDELDTYLKQFSVLSIEESNRVREIGRCLHAFMENFATEDRLPISTQLPDGGDQSLKITTEHNHQVTKTRETTETETTEGDYLTTIAPPILRTFKPINT